MHQIRRIEIENNFSQNIHISEKSGLPAMSLVTDMLAFNAAKPDLKSH